jgi:hypothetical protein
MAMSATAYTSIYGLPGSPNTAATPVFDPCASTNDLALGDTVVCWVDGNGNILDILSPAWTGGTVFVSYEAAVISSSFVRYI